MTVRLFIGNLPYNVTEAELKEHFSTVGRVSYVSLPTDRETGKMRGFAFLEFSERADAEEAVRRFNNQMFKGRPLVVNEARAREDRPRGGAPQPAPARSSPAPRAGTPDSTTRPAEAAGSNFGPDAPPRNRGKAKSQPRTERAPKGPLREVSRGQYFGWGDDDDDFTDDELGEDNFASRVETSDEDDENT